MTNSSEIEIAAGGEIVTNQVDDFAEVSPPQEVMAHWEQILSDMKATAAEYESEGWDVESLHPGHVRTITDENRMGFGVLLPDDEYQKIAELRNQDNSFERYQVFKNERAQTVFVLVAMENPEKALVVQYPLYYESHQSATLFKHARVEGEIRIYLRNLAGDSVVIIYGDPDLFVPSTEG